MWASFLKQTNLRFYFVLRPCSSKSLSRSLFRAICKPSASARPLKRLLPQFSRHFFWKIEKWGFFGVFLERNAHSGKAHISLQQAQFGKSEKWRICLTTPWFIRELVGNWERKGNNIGRFQNPRRRKKRERWGDGLSTKTIKKGPVDEFHRPFWGSLFAVLWVQNRKCKNKNCQRSTNNTRIGPAILTTFLPRQHSRHALISSPPGQNSQFSSFTLLLLKNCTYLLKKADISSRPAPILWGIFMGIAWGVQNRRRGGVRGRNCLGKPCFFGFFRTSFNYSDTPEGERMRGWRGLGLGALSMKKGPRNEFLSPLCGVLLRWKHVQDWKDENISARRNSFYA